MRKMFPFDDVIMPYLCISGYLYSIVVQYPPDISRSLLSK